MGLDMGFCLPCLHLSTQPRKGALSEKKSARITLSRISVHGPRYEELLIGSSFSKELQSTAMIDPIHYNTWGGGGNNHTIIL